MLSSQGRLQYGQTSLRRFVSRIRRCCEVPKEQVIQLLAADKNEAQEKKEQRFLK
jgi:hypothetical protein